MNKHEKGDVEDKGPVVVEPKKSGNDIRAERVGQGERANQIENGPRQKPQNIEVRKSPSLSSVTNPTPAMALGISDHMWSIGELLDAALATQPIDPIVSAPDRRKRFRVIDGGRS
jgi:hypothetical protein